MGWLNLFSSGEFAAPAAVYDRKLAGIAATVTGAGHRRADGHDDVRQFFHQCADDDARRAKHCYDLIGQLTGAQAS